MPVFPRSAWLCSAPVTPCNGVMPMSKALAHEHARARTHTRTQHYVNLHTTSTERIALASTQTPVRYYTYQRTLCLISH